MGHKQTNRQPTIVTGRRVAQPPDTRPGPREKIAARVDRNAKAAEENRKLQAENARLSAQLEKERIDRNIEDIGILKVQAGELSKLDAHKLGNLLKNKFAEHCAAGHAPRKFDPYRPMNEFMARIGKALPPPPKDASPLEAALPPPAQSGRVMPHDRAAADTALREQQERGARQRADVLRDREAYQRRLRELGLTPPDVGQPGSGGLGY
jgi:hypothetical protein